MEGEEEDGTVVAAVVRTMLVGRKACRLGVAKASVPAASKMVARAVDVM